MRLRMEAMIHEHQDKIVFALEQIDGCKFKRDSWTRKQGGGGISCVLQEGNVFEKAVEKSQGKPPDQFPAIVNEVANKLKARKLLE